MVDPTTGELVGRKATIVTDNGSTVPVRPVRAVHRPPRLASRSARVRTPAQNGSPRRGFGTLRCDGLFLDEIADGIDLEALAVADRIE